MDTKRLLVANWKMNLRPSEEIEFIRKHNRQLGALAAEASATMVICPSFLSILPASQVLSLTTETYKLSLGAQDCSTHGIGAFTGQISAACLKEAGCTHVIVGHSEERRAHKESDLHVAHKVIQLLIHGITPILCIGENSLEKKEGRSCEVLSHQLQTIIENLKNLDLKHQYVFCVAYEPLYAIGSGNVPTKDHLDQIFSHLKKEFKSSPTTQKTAYLYGGSVNYSKLPVLDSIKNICGYLVGTASLSFQELEKMLKLWKQRQNSAIPQMGN